MGGWMGVSYCVLLVSGVPLALRNALLRGGKREGDRRTLKALPTTAETQFLRKTSVIMGFLLLLQCLLVRNKQDWM